MKSSEISDAIKNIIVDINVTANKEDIADDVGLMSSEVLDSYGFVELIGGIEEKFDIEFEDSEISRENFKNIKTIVSLIQQKLSL